MQKVLLPNGLTVIFEPKKGKSVVVEVMVKVGSNQEQEREQGLSHFLEHMLFEGTKKRPNSREISNEIEKIGGDFNAYTSNEKTCFYIKVLRKHFAKAIEVLTDILQHSLFRAEDITKEKKVVLNEINMVNDDPKYYQWILLQKSLFQRHPCRHPTYGRKEVIKELTQTKVVNYFQKYYVPNNIVVSIVGDVPSWRKEVSKKLSFGTRKSIPRSKVSEPLAKKPLEKREKRKIANAYLVLGFKTVPRIHPDSYVLEVINGILGRGQSGKMFTEIRGKRGLAYDVGTQNMTEVSFGYFAIYATVDKKNIAQIKKLILKELEKLKKVNEKDLKEAKDFLEGDYYLSLEDSQKMADQLLFWTQVKDPLLMKNFIPRIKRVSAADIRRVTEKYFKNYMMVVLEGE